MREKIDTVRHGGMRWGQVAPFQAAAVPTASARRKLSAASNVRLPQEIYRDIRNPRPAPLINDVLPLRQPLRLTQLVGGRERLALLDNRYLTD